MVEQTSAGRPQRVEPCGSQLEAFSAAAARPPVRLVKLIGYEAMLVCEEVEPLVAALVELKQRTEAQERVSVAGTSGLRWGRSCAAREMSTGLP
jgi:hypothetical protein